MAEPVIEALPADASAEDKRARYAALLDEIKSVVAGERHRTARYASAACMLAHAFAPRFFWTGFYEVDPDKPQELVVGPYQGTLGCLRIPFGRGVCGAAAQSRETQLVPDVHTFQAISLVMAEPSLKLLFRSLMRRANLRLFWMWIPINLMLLMRSTRRA